VKEGGKPVSQADDELSRRFEGRGALDPLLLRAGSVADTEDVVEAFTQAVRDGVPSAVVIQALWEDEPRFESPEEARRLFGNLLGLFELVASGASVDLSLAAAPRRRALAPRPEPFGDAGPGEGFVEAAWRFFEDHPKERQRLDHAFENRHDALLSWLDVQGLSDDAFVLAMGLLSDLHAMTELGGHACTPTLESEVPAAVDGVPVALLAWVDEGVFEAEAHEVAPLPAPEGARMRELVGRAAAGWWRAARRPEP
jgi:hypothetical protein